MKTEFMLCFISGVLFGSSLLKAAGDTTVIANTADGVLESTINGDTTIGARKNPNRVYVLQRDQIYYQNAPINVTNPTGTLIIVGELGGRKPIIIMKPLHNTPLGQNAVQGSLKLVNIHYQSMQLDGTQILDNWLLTTGAGTTGGPNLPQALTIDNCLFEFAFYSLFECNGWKSGAKFVISNSYFRNMFNTADWWGSRIFTCKNPVDTLWVENVTTTSGGLTFLMQNSLTRFAYFNHNTIVNNKRTWLLNPYYLTFIVTNNIFINHNWAGEDTNIVSSYSGEPSHNPYAHMSTIDIDTIAPGSGILVQPQYFRSDSAGYTADLSAGKMRVFVSNNISYNDTLMNRYYLNENNAYNAVGPYPISYLQWIMPGGGPWRVYNVPGEWMNKRTQNLFKTYPHGMIEDNTLTSDPRTVTPGIADATVADQMALWNEGKWGFTPAPTNDILDSRYIFGDYDPTTVPGIVNGVKTEDAGLNAGIAKFTDLIENFSQTAHISAIDNLPIGCLIWNDALMADFNSAVDFQKIDARFRTLGGPSITGIKKTPSVLQKFSLSQNYPNPFNPTTTIRYCLPSASHVTMSVFNTLGQRVAELVHGDIDAGYHDVEFDGSGLASGVYFYRIQAGSLVQARRLLLLR